MWNFGFTFLFYFLFFFLYCYCCLPLCGGNCWNYCSIWVTASFFLPFLKVSCAKVWLAEKCIISVKGFCINFIFTFRVSLAHFLFPFQNLYGQIQYLWKLMPLLPVTLMALYRAVTGEDKEECYQMRSQYKRVKLYHTSQHWLFSPLFPSNVGRLKKSLCKRSSVSY